MFCHTKAITSQFNVRVVQKNNSCFLGAPVALQEIGTWKRETLHFLVNVRPYRDNRTPGAKLITEPPYYGNGPHPASITSSTSHIRTQQQEIEPHLLSSVNKLIDFISGDCSAWLYVWVSCFFLLQSQFLTWVRWYISLPKMYFLFPRTLQVCVIHRIWK